MARRTPQGRGCAVFDLCAPHPRRLRRREDRSAGGDRQQAGRQRQYRHGAGRPRGADGYTLGVANTGNIVIDPFLYRHMPYDPLGELAPVGSIGQVTLFLVVDVSRYH